MGQVVNAPEGRREGSRWINQRPDGAEVAEWFRGNVYLHDGMQHDHYVQGVTLIPNKDKFKEARLGSDGSVVLVDREQLVFTPYAKVETRIAYFWDLMRDRGWLGVIEPADVPRAEWQSSELPRGFFRFPITTQNGIVEYLGCSMQVRVYEPFDAADKPEEPREGWFAHPRGVPPRVIEAARRGRLVMEPSAGTKIVPVLNRYGDDSNSLMKAETGAVGRALGMAGMLVIPGSGVATAEDMEEAMARPGSGVGVEPELPADQPGQAASPASLKEQAETLIARVHSERPELVDEVQAWAKERKLNLGELTEESPALRGVVRFLERKLAEPKEGES